MTQHLANSPEGLGAAYAERLHRSYLNFRWPLFILEPEEYTRPCLENGWTPLASAAHIAYWDSYQLRRMQSAIDPHGIEPAPASVESNDEMAAKEDRSWDTVLSEADEARQALISFALSLTDDQIEAEYEVRGKRSQIVKVLLERMPEHVAEHAVDVHRYCFSTDRWGREKLFRFYRRHFSSLLDSITGLTEESCTTVLVNGNWTVRDVLAHILAWDEYVLELVKRWPDISLPDARSADPEVEDADELSHWASGDVDTVNARLQDARGGLTMIEVLDGLATCHRRIVSRCRRMSDEAVRTEVEYDKGERGNVVNLLVSTSAHTADHAAEIYAARADGRLVPIRLRSQPE